MSATVWVLWGLVGITSLSHAYAIRNVVKASIEVRLTMERIRHRGSEMRGLRTWMCSWCGVSPMDCQCSPTRPAPTTIGARVWQCVSCGEQPKHCECAS